MIYRMGKVSENRLFDNNENSPKGIYEHCLYKKYSDERKIPIGFQVISKLNRAIAVIQIIEQIRELKISPKDKMLDLISKQFYDCVFNECDQSQQYFISSRIRQLLLLWKETYDSLFRRNFRLYNGSEILQRIRLAKEQCYLCINEIEHIRNKMILLEDLKNRNYHKTRYSSTQIGVLKDDITIDVYFRYFAMGYLSSIKITFDESKEDVEKLIDTYEGRSDYYREYAEKLMNAEVSEIEKLIDKIDQRIEFELNNIWDTLITEIPTVRAYDNENELNEDTALKSAIFRCLNLLTKLLIYYVLYKNTNISKKLEIVISQLNDIILKYTRRPVFKNQYQDSCLIDIYSSEGSLFYLENFSFYSKLLICDEDIVDKYFTDLMQIVNIDDIEKIQSKTIFQMSFYELRKSLYEKHICSTKELDRKKIELNRASNISIVKVITNGIEKCSDIIRSTFERKMIKYILHSDQMILLKMLKDGLAIRTVKNNIVLSTKATKLLDDLDFYLKNCRISK